MDTEETYEVESKYSIAVREIGLIMQRIAQLAFRLIVLWQEDRFLPSDDRKVNLKVRADWDATEGTEKLHQVTKTRKKIKDGNGTQVEVKRPITRPVFTTLVSDAWPDGEEQPGVWKLRLEWAGTFDGLGVKICIDHAVSCTDYRVLGPFLEVEAEVQTAEEVPTARQKLDRLAEVVLGGQRKREKRGYRSLIMDGKKKKKSAKG